MMTNTYLPHVGGVARSVSTFAEEYVRLGHEVLVVAPTFDGRRLPKASETLVERIPSFRNFNGSDFSVRLPLAAALSDRLEAFQAEILHAHHPFLLGDTALRIATNKNVPILFTHHTRYEDYTHYVPFDSDGLKEIATHLPTQFANLCDAVVAPSESTARLLRRRGVTTPITVIPTGIDVEALAEADGRNFRRKLNLPPEALVIGHCGRLALEKNLGFLAEAVARFLQAEPQARFLVVGDGPGRANLEDVFTAHGVRDQLMPAGKRTGRELREAYRAMDLFVFASLTETQGMVVAEAMAAGCPVVALNASGVREVMREGENGLMLPAEASPADFAAAVQALAADPARRERLGAGASVTAQSFSRGQCAGRMIDLYGEVRRTTRRRRLYNDLHPWTALVQRLGLEWDLMAAKTQTIVDAMGSERKAVAS